MPDDAPLSIDREKAVLSVCQISIRQPQVPCFQSRHLASDSYRIEVMASFLHELIHIQSWSLVVLVAYNTTPELVLVEPSMEAGQISSSQAVVGGLICDSFFLLRTRPLLPDQGRRAPRPSQYQSQLLYLDLQTMIHCFQCVQPV